MATRKTKVADGKSRKKTAKKDNLFDGVSKDFSGSRGIIDENPELNIRTDRLDLSKDKAMTDPNSPEYAGQRSQQMKDILGMMQQGLAGLNSQENTALREQAMRSLDQQLATSMRQTEISGARGGVRGAARAAQTENLLTDRQNQQGNIEQDLLVKNIDIQDKRRNDYYGALGGQEGAESDKVAKALARLRQGEGVNLDQSNAETAARQAALTGVLGYATSKKNSDREYSLAKSGQKLGIGRTTTSSSSTGSPNQGLIDALTKLGTSHFGSDLSKEV